MSDGYKPVDVKDLTADDQKAVDAVLAEDLQNEENTIPPSDDDETSEEGEEEEEKEDDEAVIFLTPAMLEKITKNYDAPKELIDTILGISDPKVMETMIETITALITEETHKLRVISASKRALDKLIENSKKPKEEKGGENQKSKDGKKFYKIAVLFKGLIYEIEIRGRGTFKEVREFLLANHRDVFKSHDFMKQKLRFTVKGKSKSLNWKNRLEMLAWGIKEKGFEINVEAVGQASSASSSTAMPKSEPKAKAKSKSKGKKGSKTTEETQ